MQQFKVLLPENSYETMVPNFSKQDFLFEGPTLAFADVVLHAAGLPAYVAVGTDSAMKRGINSRGIWAGPIDQTIKKSSAAQNVGNNKLNEVLYVLGAGDWNSVVTTPTPNYKFGTGYKGGIATENIGVGVSQLHEDHDLAVAAVFLAFFLNLVTADTRFPGMALNSIVWSVNKKEDFDQLINRTDLKTVFGDTNCWGKLTAFNQVRYHEIIRFLPDATKPFVTICISSGNHGSLLKFLEGATEPLEVLSGAEYEGKNLLRFTSKNKRGYGLRIGINPKFRGEEFYNY